MATIRRSTKLGTQAKTAVGTSAVQVSAANGPGKVGVHIQADKANTGTIYLGITGVTTANGYGELAAGDSIYLETSAAVFAISDVAAQNVRSWDFLL